MLITKLLALASMAMSTASAIKITFCTEMDLGGNCVDETRDKDMDCKPIPGANARGDKGSSIKLQVDKDEVDFCILSEENTCLYDVDLDVAADNYYILWPGTHLNMLAYDWRANYYQCVKGTPSTITFCNDKDLKGDCITEEIDLKKLCNKLPDSNAKGDKGSSVKLTHGGRRDVGYCAFWPAEDCFDSDHKSAGDVQHVNIDSTINLDKNFVARSYYCWNPFNFGPPNRVRSTRKRTTGQTDLALLPRRGLQTFIAFCNEHNAKGGCMFMRPDTSEKCLLIPDSNAKGDKGSSVWLHVEGDEVALCAIFSSFTCGTQGPIIGEVVRADTILDLNIDYVARSYKCYQRSNDKRTDVAVPREQMADSWITFCYEKDGNGGCQTEAIAVGAGCRLIPNSNASGDKGSSVRVYDNVDAVTQCVLFASPDCTSDVYPIDDHFTKEAVVVRPGGYEELTMDFQLRAYACLKKIG